MTYTQSNNVIYPNQTGTPLYTYAPNYPQQQQVVSVAPQPVITAPYYQYPQTSIYNDPTKQAASGVNIYIYNPSGIGGQSSSSTLNSYSTPPAAPAQPQVQVTPQVPAEKDIAPSQPIAQQPIADTSISKPETDKTKRIVQLTDDYIKSLESYLRNPDETVRKTAIKEIIQRFEEDDSRYDYPSLTALLNIALQDPVPNNRLFAMSVIAGGKAHGDENTINILNNLTTSDKMYGQEAKMASSALIKAAQETETVPDYSKDKDKQ